MNVMEVGGDVVVVVRVVGGVGWIDVFSCPRYRHSTAERVKNTRSA